MVHASSELSCFQSPFGGEGESRTLLSIDKTCRRLKCNVTYKGTTGEVFSKAAEFHGLQLRPGYINFRASLINSIILCYSFFLSDTIDERSWLDSKCLDSQSKRRNSVIHLLFNTSVCRPSLKPGGSCEK